MVSRGDEWRKGAVEGSAGYDGTGAHVCRWGAVAEFDDDAVDLGGGNVVDGGADEAPDLHRVVGPLGGQRERQRAALAVGKDHHGLALVGRVDNHLDIVVRPRGWNGFNGDKRANKV